VRKVEMRERAVEILGLDITDPSLE